MDVSVKHDGRRHDEVRGSKIRDLNDDFRRTIIGGRLMVTAGVAAMGEDDVAALLNLVRRFDRFGPNNDPHGEHDFGLIEYNGERFFWKIDYYDCEARNGSDDPGDPKQTLRILTLMPASEW
jgi:hypothetical protein